jgi:predicted dienelactone hydrolase
VVGHSYGGYTALAAAGARIDTSAVMAACEPVADQALAFLCDALLPRLDDIARSAGLGSVPEGLWPAQSDPRIDAVVALAGDAFVFGRRGLDEVTVPVLAIGGTADTDSPFEWGSELTVAHASSRRKALVALEGARHMVFAGPCEQVRTVMRVVANDFCSDPVWDREQAHEVIGRFTTAFLLAELKGDPEAVETMAQGSSAVTYRQRGYLQDDDSE